MMTVAFAIAIAVVLVFTVWALTRGRTPELPKSEPPAKPQLEKKAAPPAPPSPAAAKPQAASPIKEQPKAADESPSPAEASLEVAAEPAREAAPQPHYVETTPSGRPTERALAVDAMRKGLASTRGGFISRLAKLFGENRQINPALLEEIEEVLITADIGVRMTDRILETLRAKQASGQLSDEKSVWEALRAEAAAILDVGQAPLKLANKPSVILVVGVNGVGKTTTIGKLASKYASEGRKVLLAAGDTFRAAAVLQLEMWGKRVGCPVVKGKENADPSSVIFEALKKATDEGFDLVIADTAGRLHTKAPLMDELQKVERTVGKALNGRNADEVFLVLDSTTGQNAVQQMNMFREAVGVTGVVLTKLDGTAKGGVILPIVGQHRVPVRFIGLGEKVEDLREFEATTFVEALFARPDDETMAA
jgi:fused signal recognition particle receptor